MPWMESVTIFSTPCPTETRVMTAPTPMIMPSMVSIERSLLAVKAPTATRMLSVMFMQRLPGPPWRPRNRQRHLWRSAAPPRSPL